VVRPFRVFLPTEMSTECDACGRRFDLVKGGACKQCGRILCERHLHGSLVRRLLVDLGAKPVCVQCRSR
jgi:FYVE-type zinc finger protein